MGEVALPLKWIWPATPEFRERLPVVRVKNNLESCVALEHRDSSGGRGVVRPGELQHMTAGTGVMHSEFNPRSKEPTHLLQIWLFPVKPRSE
ncbi:MAG TPA: pirin family protein [Verrucomicrobiae bacterium]|jgi:hypothetical protein|nr:pirin family protein [Verrucomicrobiae bacterium]